MNNEPINAYIREHLHIPAFRDIRAEQARKDCERADALGNVLAGIETLRNMRPDEVAEILRALERADRGECSVSLQQAREDAESQARVNV